jgi:hypothetical protein
MASMCFWNCSRETAAAARSACWRRFARRQLSTTASNALVPCEDDDDDGDDDAAGDADDPDDACVAAAAGDADEALVPVLLEAALAAEPPDEVVPASVGEAGPLGPMRRVTRTNGRTSTRTAQADRKATRLQAGAVWSSSMLIALACLQLTRLSSIERRLRP